MSGGKQFIDSLIDRASQVAGGYLDSSQTSNSTTITNTTTETAFSVSRTLPANALRAGSMVKVTASIRCLSTNSTDTLTIRGRVGGSDIVVSGAVDVANNDTVEVSFWLKARAAPGASVAVVGNGHVIFSTGANGTLSTASVLPDSQTLATNGTLVVDVTAQWSVANAANQVIMEDFNVSVKHAA